MPHEGGNPGYIPGGCFYAVTKIQVGFYQLKLGGGSRALFGHLREGSLQLFLDLGLLAPGREIRGDFVVESEEGRVWGGEGPQINIMPYSPPSKALIFFWRINLCCLEGSCNSRIVPLPTWLLAALGQLHITWLA